MCKFVKDHGLRVNKPSPMSEKRMKEEAHTKEKRQELLTSFFRAVFAHVSCLNSNSNKILWCLISAKCSLKGVTNP